MNPVSDLPLIDQTSICLSPTFRQNIFNFDAEGVYLVVVTVLPGGHLLPQSLQTVPHLQTKTHQSPNTTVPFTLPNAAI